MWTGLAGGHGFRVNLWTFMFWNGLPAKRASEKSEEATEIERFVRLFQDPVQLFRDCHLVASLEWVTSAAADANKGVYSSDVEA